MRIVSVAMSERCSSRHLAIILEDADKLADILSTS